MVAAVLVAHAELALQKGLQEVLRAHYRVFSDDKETGEITSGAYSPTLGKSIALARLDTVCGNFSVDIRGKRFPVELVRPPFVRKGRQVYKAWNENK